MKWAGAIGAAVAGLILAWTGGSFFRNGGISAMDTVPWGFVLMTVLMISMAVAGISLFRAPNNTAIFVMFASAIMGSPLVLMWIAFSFGD